MKKYDIIDTITHEVILTVHTHSLEGAERKAVKILPNRIYEDGIDGILCFDLYALPSAN